MYRVRGGLNCFGLDCLNRQHEEGEEGIVSLCVSHYTLDSPPGGIVMSSV